MALREVLCGAIVLGCSLTTAEEVVRLVADGLGRGDLPALVRLGAAEVDGLPRAGVGLDDRGAVVERVIAGGGIASVEVGVREDLQKLRGVCGVRARARGRVSGGPAAHVRTCCHVGSVRASRHTRTA